jgi:hypothetical protein
LLASIPWIPLPLYEGSGAIGKIKLRDQSLDVVLKQPARLPIPVEYRDRERR